MRYNYRTIFKMPSCVQSRWWSAICLVALLSFFALATHAHLDGNNDIKCPTCQAGSLQFDTVDAGAALSAPQLASFLAFTPDESHESQFQFTQHPPRAPPV